MALTVKEAAKRLKREEKLTITKSFRLTQEDIDLLANVRAALALSRRGDTTQVGALRYSLKEAWDSLKKENIEYNPAMQIRPEDCV